MAEGTASLGRCCAAGATTAALVAATAVGTSAAAVPPEEDGGAPAHAGERSAEQVGSTAWSEAPASAAFAPGVPPAVAAALTPTASDSDGERAASVDGTTLSIRISDGREEIAAGEEADYTLTLRNEGDRRQKAIVSQRVSADAEFVDVGADGMATGGVATWSVVVEPGDEIERTARVRLGEPGERLWRVATTACAQTEEGAPPVACATDADRVDRAARADRVDRSAPTTASTVSTPQRVLTVTSLFTGILIVVATIAAAVILWIRLRLRPNARRHSAKEDGAV